MSGLSAHVTAGFVPFALEQIREQRNYTDYKGKVSQVKRKPGLTRQDIVPSQ